MTSKSFHSRHVVSFLLLVSATMANNRLVAAATDTTTLHAANKGASPRLLHYPLTRLEYDDTKEHDRRRRTLQQEIDVFDETTDHDRLFRGYGTHYVNLYVGCPNPQLQTLIVDTGSSTTGFPCSACQGCGEGCQLNPVYNETASECFRPLSCADESCSVCRNNQCWVAARYSEGSSWSGTESTDMATIGGRSADEEPFSLSFACQNDITGLFQTQLADGITGFAKHPESLWYQLYQQDLIDAQQFSLCMISSRTPQSSAGILVLGGTDVRLHDDENAMRFARVVPEAIPYFWKLRIRKIFVAVDGEKAGSRTSNGTATIPADEDWVQVVTDNLAQASLTPLVDSGTTYTYMDPSFEAPLREAWERVTTIPFGIPTYTAEDLANMPTFWFQFEGVEGAGTTGNTHSDPDHPNDILVKFPSSRYLNGFDWRLYFDATEPKMVLGANFMSTHDILFDNGAQRIGFAESKCVLPPSSPADTDNHQSSGASPADTDNHQSSGARCGIVVSLGSTIFLFVGAAMSLLVAHSC